MPYAAPFIDAEGLHLPSFADRLEALRSAYASVFGVPPGEDTPDAQLLATLARALDDASVLVDQVYRSRLLAESSGLSLDLAGAASLTPRRAGESDADYRRRIRCARAAAGCARGECIDSALRSLPYLRDASVPANPSDAASADGLPPHSVACVAYGGTNAAVAAAILDKKAPGLVTFGDQTAQAEDADHLPRDVRFSRASTILLSIVVRLRPLEGWEDATGPLLKQAVLAFVQSLPIGRSLHVGSLYSVCYGAVPARTARTFFIADILTSSTQGAHADLYPCAWNERLSTLESMVSVELIQ